MPLLNPIHRTCLPVMFKDMSQGDPYEEKLMPQIQRPRRAQSGDAQGEDSHRGAGSTAP